jgi:hypothetical protein
MIGPEGGSIRSSDGVLTLKIPAGALSVPVAIGLAQAPNSAPGGVGSGYDISPDGLAFAKPALLTLTYGPGGLDVPEVGGIALAFPSGTSWAGVTGGRIDTSAKTLTITFPNTTPPQPSSLAPGPATHAKSGSSHVAPLEGFQIDVARGKNWVPTDGTRTLQVYFLLPPSGTGEKPESYPISSLMLDPADVTFFQPKIGSISRTFVDKADYTAPHSIARASLPVKIHVRALVTRGTRVPIGYYERIGIIHVVRRRWLLNVQFKLNLACIGSNKDYAYSYADDQTQTFHLGDDLSLTADPFLGGLPSDATVKNCACTATMVRPPGTVVFTGVSGSLVTGNPARFDMVGKAGIAEMVPPIRYTCPNGIGGTVTDTAEPFGIDFFMFLGLLGVGGIHPSDGVERFIITQSPLVTAIVEWRSIVE